MKTKQARLFLLPAALVVVSVIGLEIAVNLQNSSDKIARGVVVSGIDIGGKSRKYAEISLSNIARQKLLQPVEIDAMGRKWKGSLSDFGVNIKWKESVEKAYSIGRNGNVFQKMISSLTSKGSGKKFDTIVAVDEKVLKHTIAKAARDVDIPHKNAKIDIIDGNIIVHKESCGVCIDQDKSLDILVKSLQKGNYNINLPAITDKPDITADDLYAIDTLLGRYSTHFSRAKVDRSHNLGLAVKSIDGIVLKPGEEFSYNKALGPRIAGRGYRNAIVFVKGKTEPGLGGGICQVSSNLYNIALMTGMDIVERHHHSRTVTYVPPGRDATVAYGARDFRFKNINSNPVYISSKIIGSNVIVEIYGSSRDQKKIKVYSRTSNPVPKKEETVVDKTLAPGVKKVEDIGASGITAVVYREIISQDGKAIVEVVSKDKYLPQNKIIAVGPSSRKTQEEVLAPANLLQSGQNNNIHTN